MRPLNLVLSIPDGYRRPKIKKWFDELNVPFEFFDGIRLQTRKDLMAVAADLDIQVDDRAMTISRGNLGAILAWLRLLRHVASMPDPYVVVFEDDCEPLNEHVARVFLSSPLDFAREFNLLGKEMIFVHAHVVITSFGTQAQLISPAAARKIWDQRQFVFDEVVADRHLLDLLIIKNILPNKVDWVISPCAVFAQREPLDQGERCKYGKELLEP